MNEILDELFTIEGSVENIIYKNDENGYSVFSLLSGEDEIVCVGNVISLNEGESMKISGVFVMHPFYGRQLSIKTFDRVMPSTEQGIERYLSSGVIKGVGAKLAARIVGLFGADTFNVIETEPERLAEIKGISSDKALQIADSYIKQIEMKNAMIYLQDLGLGATNAIKIYMAYRENTFDVIKTNPYRIADEIFGIGFKTADAIAEKVGIEKTSVYRIKSGIKYTLSAWASNGHTFMPKETLCEECAVLLGEGSLPIADALTDLQMDGHVVQKTVNGFDAVYLSYYYNAESYCAKKIALLARDAEKTLGGVEKDVEAFEQKNGLTLAEKQKEAVKEAISRNVLVITGGPGTGKTTTINALIYILEKDGGKVILAAPTGRAAKRMTEATGRDAQTIHRLLVSGRIEDSSTFQRFEKDEENPLECDAVIIDETSMVDVLLLNSLLKAVPQGVKLILVGDANQLPSVGAGNVLSDIIRSGCIKAVALDTVFRQAQKSAIIMNAHRILGGETPVFNEKDTDFFFVRRETATDAANAVLELINERLPKYLNGTSKTDIQVLTPMRKSALGVSELNKLLQEKLNPPSQSKNERELRTNVFREGDKVMQIKNNYDVSWVIKDKKGWLIDEGTGVFNGDQGIISEIGEETITVLFDDGKQVIYEWSRIDELELAYAITIHKSQGSEYPAVVIPILTGPYMLMTRNLLYTAVTRAKKLVVLVGLREKIEQMVGNNMEVKRYSSLKEQLVRSFSLLM